MRKYLNASVEDGMDTLLRVVGVLRRREFIVNDVSMKTLSKSSNSNISISLDNSTEQNILKAVAHLEKIIGISNVKILEEEMQ